MQYFLIANENKESLITIFEYLKEKKEIQKYFNDLDINDTYKLYIPQLEIHNSNKNSINNDLKIRNNKNI